MAVSDTDAAVPILRASCDEHYPVTAWLACLPLFDPLRSDAAFLELVERVKKTSSGNPLPFSVD